MNPGIRKLPQPSPEALAHSALLQQTIVAQIKKSGPLSFSRYMQMALYEPGLGYYCAGAQKWGAQGDYVTASEISPLFSRTMAHYFAEQLQKQPQQSILEFGAGTGVFAKDALLELEQLQILPACYAILEVSAELRQRQQSMLQHLPSHLQARVRWLDRLPAQWDGILFANEVLDAMPVERFQKTETQGIVQGMVGVDAVGELQFFYENSKDARFKQAVEPVAASLLPGYESEISLLIPPWIHSMAEVLRSGKLMVVDYGFLQHEFYHPDRHMGTLMCHYQHHAHDDPLWHPGIQDITAHVNFSAVIEAAERSGLALETFTTQADFLLKNGLLNLLNPNQDYKDYYQEAQAVKKLLMPGEMGELFKVAVFGR